MSIYISSVKPFYSTLALVALLSLSACGGSNNSGGINQLINQPSQPVTWEKNKFEPEAKFVARCVSPRSGLFPGTSTAYPDRSGTVLQEKHWLRAWNNNYYLWYDEVEDQNPALFDNPIDYFQQLKTLATTSSGTNKDQFHFTIPTDEYLQQSQSGVSAGYGVTFSFINVDTPPREIVVAYTEPNTPASANLKRGTRILEVDGRDLVNTTDRADLAPINAGLFPFGTGETHTFKVQDVGSSTTRTITITSAVITSQPVQNVKIIDTDTGKVGYFTFNAHIGTAEKQLIDAISSFKDEDISDLIIDLRYNGGGAIYIAIELGSMIAGAEAANGQPVGTIKFNDKHADQNESSPFLTQTPANTPNPNVALPILNLSRVFVLTGPGTCSASELVMNGLRGVDVEVIQIGTTTCGKPYGFNPADNCGTAYFSVNFKTENAKGFSEYADGFSPVDTTEDAGVLLPGCSVKDDFTHELGDESEARLATALFYRDNGACPVSAGRAKGASALSSIDGNTIKPIWLNNMILHKPTVDKKTLK